jgi:hypothetical protein
MDKEISFVKFKAIFTEPRKLTDRNQIRESHDVLRQTGFETPLSGRCRGSQLGRRSKKSRVLAQGAIRFLDRQKREQRAAEKSINPAEPLQN